MNRIALFIFLAHVWAGLARADLTIVQKVEGGAGGDAGGINQMTIKIRGDKTRIDTGPQASVIIDGRTGDMLTLMHKEKQVIRISGDRAKAIAEMASKFQGNGGLAQQQSKLTSTGRKEMFNGLQTEIYTSEFPQGKATYWVALNYPNAQEILKQMQAVQPGAWRTSQAGMPDFRDFPGVPVKTVVDLAGNHITTTLVSIGQDPIADIEFAVPTGYAEMKVPKILGGAKPDKTAGASEEPIPQAGASASP